MQLEEEKKKKKKKKKTLELTILEEGLDWVRLRK